MPDVSPRSPQARSSGGRLGQVRALSRGELLRLLVALVVLPPIAVSLRVAGLKRTLRVLGRLPRRREPAPGRSKAVATESARAVWIASRHGLVRARCLPRTVALWWLLRAQGVGSEIRVSARLERGDFDAHAWVERSGERLLASDDAVEWADRFPGDLATVSLDVD